MILNPLVKIGDFITRGRFMIVDPCYASSDDHGGFTWPVMKGKWRAYVAMSHEDVWGERVAALMVYHESVVPARSFSLKSWHVNTETNKIEVLSKWRNTDMGIPVDGGQAGFFDYVSYNRFKDRETDDDTLAEYCYGDYRSSKIPASTATYFKAGFAFSESGCGDGWYPMYEMRTTRTSKRNGECVGLMLDFLGFYPEHTESLVIKSLRPDELPTMISVEMTDGAKSILETRLKESK